MVSTRSFRGARMIRFDEFELDIRAGELRRNGAKVKLQEQPFRILVMLLEKPGEVVLREDIRRKLWPNGTIVEVGHGINAAVLRLREALGDSAGDPRFVETLARRGYRFKGPTETVYREGTDPRTTARQAPDTGDLRGQTVSHYRVIEKLGGGGMGVVYRAEDLKLGRHVALKFLPPELVGDANALSRFHREARAASALNHPNICTVYGVDEHCGQPLIVMEMVEGETLESELSRGPLPASKALALAIQIADALHAAHQRGVIHRDLKPGNILVTRSGVKLLDFGLAKICHAGDGSQVTRERAILGTLHYMSPEQVQGKDAGAASDIFSFGLVLYEMIAGKRVFPGENSAIVMSAILTGEPPELRDPSAPAGLDLVLRRCLAKNPEARWQSASDLKAALERIAAPPLAPTPKSSHRRNPIAVLAAFALGSAVLWGAWKVYEMQPRPYKPPLTAPAVIKTLPAVPTPPSASAPATQRAAAFLNPHPPVVNPGGPGAIASKQEVTRFTVWPPGDGNVTRLALSPDGRSVAFTSGGQLFVRAFDSLEPRLLEGTEGAGTPFWSPDGRQLAFSAKGELKIIPADGSQTPVSLCPVNTNMRGDWRSDGTILIGLIGDGIFRVSVATKTIAQVTRIDPERDETRHLLPQFLPDGRRFLFIAGANKVDRSMLYAGSLDSPERTPIMPVKSSVEFVSSRTDNQSGYLIFADGSTLMARAFDPVKLRVNGNAFPVAGPIASVNAAGTNLGVGDFSASGGSLAYRASGTPAAMETGVMHTTTARKYTGNIIVVQNWIAGVKR
ncbi:MAG TPA: protein kinase [Bryobacteraceae bacterium]|nr:protein kinase [Bryobacteraceae bacterium]